LIKIFDREVKVTRKVKIKIMLLLIEDERELQSLKDKELKDSILLTLQFKNSKTKKLREKNNKTYREFSRLRLSFK